MTTSPMCAALSKVQDVLNLIFYWPRICHFSGTPFHKQCLVLCCHLTTPEPPAAVFLGKAQAIQNVPSDVSKGPRRGWRQAQSCCLSILREQQQPWRPFCRGTLARSEMAWVVSRNNCGLSPSPIRCVVTASRGGGGGTMTPTSTCVWCSAWS